MRFPLRFPTALAALLLAGTVACSQDAQDEEPSAAVPQGASSDAADVPPPPVDTPADSMNAASQQAGTQDQASP